MERSEDTNVISIVGWLVLQAGGYLRGLTISNHYHVPSHTTPSCSASANANLGNLK